MGHDKKKQLTKLLAFVKELYDHPDNKDFAAGIQAMVAADEDFREKYTATAPSGEELKRIEKYLSLDFGLDEMNLADFSLIKDDGARDKLESDYREMLRYRFGTRSHKVDFPEFCRYATLQTEMLVNYYYDSKYKADITKIQEVLKDGNKKVEADGTVKYFFKPDDKTRYIHEIGLKPKIQALQQEWGWQYGDIQVYIFTMYVRHNQSHRSLHVSEDLIRETEEKLKAGGAWNYKFDTPDYKKAAFVVDKGTLNEYKFQVWVAEEPFDKVLDSIKKMSDQVVSSL